MNVDNFQFILSVRSLNGSVSIIVSAVVGVTTVVIAIVTTEPARLCALANRDA